MPKIGKNTFQINGQCPEFEMHYSRKEGFYLKDFPEEVWKLSDYEYRPSFSSEQQLLNTTKEAINQYHAKIETKKKVIVVEFILGSDYTMNKVSQGSYQGQKKGISRDFADKVNGFGRIPTAGISFSYDVCWLVDSGGLHLHRMNNTGTVGNKMQTSPSKVLYIDFTEDREEFMVSVNKAFQALAEKLIGFFSVPEEDLVKAIENKGAKLLT